VEEVDKLIKSLKLDVKNVEQVTFHKKSISWRFCRINCF